MKKRIIVVISVGLVCLLVGLQAGYMLALDQYELPKLTIWRQRQIETDWLSCFGSEPFPWHEDSYAAGTRYYGTYGGYDILYAQGWEFSGPGKKKIGNFWFEDGHGFELYAYKRGEFFLLSNVYDDGWITDKEVEEIYNLHLRYEKEFG